MNEINIDSIHLKNKHFWYAFFTVSYPNGYDETSDISVEEITSKFADLKWWNTFTHFSEEILQENDGYLEKPTYMKLPIDENNKLLIEFHPSDILYYLNENLIGNTGSHWKLQIFPFEELKVLINGYSQSASLLAPNQIKEVPHLARCVLEVGNSSIWLNCKNREILFWLLLPLAKISIENMEKVTAFLTEKLTIFFETKDICKTIAKCISFQLLEI